MSKHASIQGSEQSDRRAEPAQCQCPCYSLHKPSPPGDEIAAGIGSSARTQGKKVGAALQLGSLTRDGIAQSIAVAGSGKFWMSKTR